ncbi:MAG: hypothetical protein JNM07_13205 [Phycisphaerae bacterium]|nr:hypothetical protein [Phycisphaerae bacterium]
MFTNMATLLQAEADNLRTMPKTLAKAERAEFEMPTAGDGRSYQMVSLDGRTTFLFDVNRRGKIKLTRCSYQERYRITDILARLDIDGPPHTNPDVTTPPLPALAAHAGATIACPHFHYYVEGFDDRWAVPASEAGFRQTTDLILALREFMSHCGVQDVPTIQHPMF